MAMLIDAVVADACVCARAATRSPVNQPFASSKRTTGFGLLTSRKTAACTSTPTNTIRGSSTVPCRGSPSWPNHAFQSEEHPPPMLPREQQSGAEFDAGHFRLRVAVAELEVGSALCENPRNYISERDRGWTQRIGAFLWPVLPVRRPQASRFTHKRSRTKSGFTSGATSVATNGQSPLLRRSSSEGNLTVVRKCQSG